MMKIFLEVMKVLVCTNREKHHQIAKPIVLLHPWLSLCCLNSLCRQSWNYKTTASIARRKPASNAVHGHLTEGKCSKWPCFALKKERNIARLVAAVSSLFRQNQSNTHKIKKTSATQSASKNDIKNWQEIHPVNFWLDESFFTRYT